MFVFDAAALLHPEAEPVRAGEAPPVRGLRRLLAGVTARLWSQRRLQARTLALPRPTGCGWLPRRAWRRHAALIYLRAGIDPDTVPPDTVSEETAG